MYPNRPVLRAALACALAASAAAASIPPALAAPAPAKVDERLHARLKAAAADAGSVQRRQAEPVSTGQPGAAHAPGQVIVTFEPDASAAQRTAAIQAISGRVIEDLGTPRQVLVDLPNAVPTGQGRDALERQPGVQYASLNGRAELLAVTNDPLLKDQYALWSPAAGGFASPDADVEATAAWDQSTGAGATVAIIDQGVELGHPDLASQIAYNAGEQGGGKETNRDDDDDNGYIDDWRGWDPSNDDNSPLPYAQGKANYHGTHVAGLVAARGGDGFGISGAAPGARLIPLQVQAGKGFGDNPAGSLLADSVIKAIHYAGKRGANVANMSLGVTGDAADHVATAISAYPDTLFVGAAGNSYGVNRDASPLAPCTTPAPNVICVGATNDRAQIADFSDIGRTSVDLFAPGERIVSTVLNGEHIAMSGTSMATPIVAGAAAAYKAKYPAATPVQIKAALLTTTDPIKNATAKSVTGGRLNLAAALQSAPGAPASAPTATVSSSGGVVRYTGSGTLPHVATVRTDGADIAIQTRATLTATAPCTVVSGGARCPAAQVTSVAMTGASGNDRFVNDTGLPATLSGLAGTDTLLGGVGTDTLNGGEGDDTLQGFAGGDTLTGGTGVDTVTYAERNAGDVVTATLDGQRNDGVGAEADLISADVESLVGHIGPDNLSGGSGVDRLYGIGGDDILSGKGGNDILDGGQGRDRVGYLSAPSAVSVSLGNAAPQSSGGDGGDTITSVEGIIGSSFNDALTGDTGANTLDGGLGTDYLNGGAGSDWFEAALASALTIDLRLTSGQAVAGSGQKILANIENVRGTDGADVLKGTTGNNVLAPGLGNDTVDGISGDDTVSYARPGLAPDAPGVNVSLAITGPQSTGTAGTDTILNVDNIEDSPGRDVLAGNDGPNRFDLLAGDMDKVDGRGGTDAVDLSRREVAYSDVTVTTAGAEPTAKPRSAAAIIGVKALESTTGTVSEDTFISGPGNDVFDGGPFRDTLSYAEATAGVTISLGTTQAQGTGGAGQDAVQRVENLTGSPFDDVLTGDDRMNSILAGSGRDTVTSGGAADYVYTAGDDVDTVECGDDEDFTYSDLVDLLGDSCEEDLRF